MLLTQEYKVNPAAFPEIRKRLIRRLVLVYAVIIVSMAVAFLLSRASFDLATTGIMTVAAILAAFFTGSSAVRRRMELYATLNIVVSEILILSESSNCPTIEIYLNGIRKIELLKNGGIIVRGRTRREAIGIPRQIERYEALKDTLERIMPLTPSSLLARYQWFTLGYSILFVATFIFFLITKDRGWAFYTTGIVASGILAQGFISRFRNGQSSPAEQKRGWLGLLVFTVVVGRLLMHLIDF